MRPDELAAVADGVIATMKSVLAPVHERIAAIEDSIDTRVALIVRDAELTITRDIGHLRERVTAIEARPPQPGPEGPPGPPGPPGHDGKDGKDGYSVTYEGPYTAGKTYARGHIVNHQGSGWHCNEDGTTARPGDGTAAWTLVVKRGQDGKDAKGAH